MPFLVERDEKERAHRRRLKVGGAFFRHGNTAEEPFDLERAPAGNFGHRAGIVNRFRKRLVNKEFLNDAGL